MANTFFSIPLPASGNGSGDAVDTADVGATKTLLASGTLPGAAIVIDGSNDGESWFPIAMFQSARAGRGVQVAAVAYFTGTP